jgi:tetratricopeptide (TPR) repeat protein
MRISSFRFSGVLPVLLFTSCLMGQNLREPQFVERTQLAFQDIMNLDYDKALQAFASLEKDYPKHPSPPLYAASVYWLNEMLRRQDVSLSRFISPMYFSQKTGETMPPAERSAFFQALQKSESLSRAILKNSPKDKDARYFLGTAYGLRSSFAITIDHSLTDAFSNGRKTFSYARQLIDEDPGYYDAYLSAGIYEYIVANIPWYWKWMAIVIGLHGDKHTGIKQVKLAAEKGQYVNNEARLVLMVLYVREHLYKEAKELSQNLHSRFPRSFLFALSNAQILQLAGFKEQAIAEYLEAERQIEARAPNFDKVSLQSFRYQLGVELMHMDKQDLALERFRQGINDPQTPFKEKALSHLNLGRILSWTGRKEEAANECQLVLSLKEGEDSHSQARFILNNMKQK